MAQAETTSPRGTDRTRRRRAQQQHAEQAQDEVAKLASPSSEEKTAAIEANKHRTAAFGGDSGSIRKERQARHRAKADAEAAALPEAAPRLPPTLKPGAQVDLITANRMAQAHDAEEDDYTTEAARAAGLAVRSSLRGTPLRGRHTRSRYIAEHNRRVAAAAAKTS
jgi:hypothetical protein